MLSEAVSKKILLFAESELTCSAKISVLATPLGARRDKSLHRVNDNFSCSSIQFLYETQLYRGKSILEIL